MSLPNFAFFTVKFPSDIQRSVSQENAFQKGKNLLPFLGKTIGSNDSLKNYLILIRKKVQVFKIA